MSSKSVFSGMISLGLLSVPIKLYVANRTHDLKFKSLCPNCKIPIKEETKCGSCGSVFDTNGKKTLLKGFKPSKSQPYIEFKQEEINTLKVKSNKEVVIAKFIDGSSIDSLMMEKSYYALPNEDFGKKPYFLLKEVLALTNKVGIGTITLKTRESLCLIRAYRNSIVVSMLSYPNEIVDIDELFEEKGVAVEQVGGKELELSQMLIKALTDDNADLKVFKDTYTEKLEEMINLRIHNLPIPIQVVAEEVKETTNILKALEESLKKVKEDG